MPPLVATEDPRHLMACHNPVRPEEVEAARPLGPGFRAAPAPDPSEVPG